MSSAVGNEVGSTASVDWLNSLKFAPELGLAVGIVIFGGFFGGRGALLVGSTDVGTW